MVISLLSPKALLTFGTAVVVCGRDRPFMGDPNVVFLFEEAALRRWTCERDAIPSEADAATAPHLVTGGPPVSESVARLATLAVAFRPLRRRPTLSLMRTDPCGRWLILYLSLPAPRFPFFFVPPFSVPWQPAAIESNLLSIEILRHRRSQGASFLHVYDQTTAVSPGPCPFVSRKQLWDRFQVTTFDTNMYPSSSLVKQQYYPSYS